MLKQAITVRTNARVEIAEEIATVEDSNAEAKTRDREIQISQTRIDGKVKVEEINKPMRVVISHLDLVNHQTRIKPRVKIARTIKMVRPENRTLPSEAVKSLSSHP